MKRQTTRKSADRAHGPSVSLAAVEETLRLYDGWLSYLLRRLGETTVRVEAADLREALQTLSCRVERDGSGYVIRLESGCDRERAGGARRE